MTSSHRIDLPVSVPGIGARKFTVFIARQGDTVTVTCPGYLPFPVTVDAQDLFRAGVTLVVAAGPDETEGREPG